MVDAGRAPIALFTYKRLRHTQQTIEALRRNELAGESDLFIFSDGPRIGRDLRPVNEVRDYIKRIDGFRRVTVIERDRNLGLAVSIISGVTEIVQQYGKIIVLEDDMVTSPYFLTYMNEALALYQDDERVISIHGYLYPLRARLPETFFLLGADCWGWATWKRGWGLFESDGEKLLQELTQRRLLERFNLYGVYPYARMLRDQIKKKNDSWAVRWYASALLNDKLTLYPGQSLVQNIGLDRSGMHCKSTYAFDTALSSKPICVRRIELAENNDALKEVIRYFKAQKFSHATALLGRVKELLCRRP